MRGVSPRSACAIISGRMTDEDRYGGYTPARATRFYIPLFLQAFAQSLTYPLVAAIVSHGRYGDEPYAAYALGQNVMLVIGALGGGRGMTGMVFARTLAGYRSFIRMNTWMMCVLLGIQMLLSLPPFDTILFKSFLNLPDHLVPIARRTLFWGFLMQGFFFLRNVPLVVLFNNRASAEATLATVVRIGITLLAPVPFVHYGLTGDMWGLAATTAACGVELVLSHVFARKFVRKLETAADFSTPEEDTSAFRQFRFTIPLSLGGFLLASSPFLIATFVNRTADGVQMLALHYATIGLANPVSYGAFRMQAVAIQFPPEYDGDRRVVRYAVCAGLLLGLIPLVAALPGVSDWYFHTVQNIPAQNVRFAQIVMCCYAAWPVFQCVRGHAEGHAAWLKQTSAILVGQIAHASTIVLALTLAWHLGMPGWTMGCAALFCATLATIAAIKTALRFFGARRA